MKTKIRLNIRVLALFITIILFTQISAYYGYQSSVNNLEDKIDVLFGTVRSSDALMLEQIQNHEDMLNVYASRIDEVNDRIKELESTIASIEKKQSSSKGSSSTSSNKAPVTNSDLSHLYYGRLHVPSVGINVALYYGWSQYITDRKDSANIFTWDDCPGYTIADHNNQEFSKLFKVDVGTKGYIEHKNGYTINIECVDIFDGYNTGKYIVDTNGVNAANRTDYMMYTCLYRTNGVLICLWEIT